MNAADANNKFCVKTVEDVFKAFPVPKPKTAKDRKALEEAKKAAAEEEALRKLEPSYIKNDEALDKAEAW